MRKKVYQQLLVLFFLTMLLFTILSRIMDSVMIAKVLTGRTQRKNINSTIEGSAAMEAGDIALVTSEKGYRIERVSVLKGSKTTPDTELFRYQLESIEDAKRNIQMELEKLLLELKTTQISAQVITSVSAEEILNLEIYVAEKELTLAQEKHNEGQVNYQENIQLLADAYQKKKNLTEDELRHQNETAYRNKEQSYTTAKANRDKNVRDAKRNVEDAEKERNRLETEDADAEEILKAQKKLDRAQEDLDELIDQWDDTLDSIEEQILLDEGQADYIGSGWTQSQISLEEEYHLNLEKEKQTLLGKEDELKKAYSNLQQLHQNMVLSQKKDAAVQAENLKQKQMAELSLKSITLDIEKKQMELADIDCLLAQNGIVTAGVSGTVVEIKVEIGQITTGNETVQIATGNFRIRGIFEKSGDILIQKGNDVAFRAGSEDFNGMVDIVDLSHNERGEFVANTDFKDAVVGMSVHYRYTEKSDIYDKVLPLSAIHKDIKGYYCLTVQEDHGILGTEFTAARVNLEVIFSGTEAAAVEGNLGDETRIILETDTIIQEGDRIRLVNKL